MAHVARRQVRNADGVADALRYLVGGAERYDPEGGPLGLRCDGLAASVELAGRLPPLAPGVEEHVWDDLTAALVQGVPKWRLRRECFFVAMSGLACDLLTTRQAEPRDNRARRKVGAVWLDEREEVEHVPRCRVEETVAGFARSR